MEKHIFRGARFQRGYGLGGFFSKLLRSALPILRSGGRYLTQKALKTGMHTLQDISMGHEPRSALKRRLADTSDELLDHVKSKIRRKMTGGGVIPQRRKQQILKKGGKTTKRMVKRAHEGKNKKKKNMSTNSSDIFDLY